MANKKQSLDVFPEVYKTSKGVLMPIGGMPVKGDSISQVFAQRGEARRQEMLGFIQRYTNLVTEIRNIALATEHSKLRLIVPPEMFERLQDGSWDLREAKDGSGLLPIAVDSDSGQFAKQVRLKWTSDDLNARTVMANMAAHAKTHALLQQVLAKLDVIDAKLDLVLANQRAEWHGKIAAGLQTIERVQEGRQPLTQHSSQRLIAAEQSIREGCQAGMRILKNTLSNLSPKRNLGKSALDFIFSRKPSDVLAEKLDELRGDVEVLATGVRALIAIATLLEDEIAAHKELSDFAKDIAETLDQHAHLIRSARYDPNRESFWRQKIPVLAMQPTFGGLVIEFEVKECLRLADIDNACSG